MNIEKDSLLKILPIVLLVGIGVSVLALFAVTILPGSSDTRKVYRAEPDPMNIRPKRGRPIPPLDVAIALSASSSQLKKGKALYSAQCSSCHGTEGYGNGPAGRALNPVPRNFSIAKEWKNGYRVTDIFGTLSKGLKQMPAFDYLTPAERFTVAHYVQSLGDFDHGPEREDAEQYLQEEYNVSKGGRAPNKVAIDFAIELIQKDQLQPKLNLPPEDDDSDEARLLRRIIIDEQRAALMLSRLPNWQNLTQVLAAGAPENGFSPSVGLLSENELISLQGELSDRLEGVKGGEND